MQIIWHIIAMAKHNNGDIADYNDNVNLINYELPICINCLLYTFLLFIFLFIVLGVSDIITLVATFRYLSDITFHSCLNMPWHCLLIDTIETFIFAYLFGYMRYVSKDMYMNLFKQLSVQKQNIYTVLKYVNIICYIYIFFAVSMTFYIKSKTDDVCKKLLHDIHSFKNIEIHIIIHMILLAILFVIFISNICVKVYIKFIFR